MAPSSSTRALCQRCRQPRNDHRPGYDAKLFCVATNSLTFVPASRNLHGMIVAELDLLGAAANAVWQYIGGDILASAAETSRRGDAVTISRNEVIELACDAGRLEQELRRAARTRSGKLWDEVPDIEATIAKWDRLQWPLHRTLLQPYFPYKRYGF